jgi:hypothetical protein
MASALGVQSLRLPIRAAGGADARWLHCEMLAVPVDNFDPKSATSVTL